MSEKVSLFIGYFMNGINSKIQKVNKQAPIKILNFEMSQGNSQIRITCFKQLAFDQPNEVQKPMRGQYLFNLIIYSQTKSLKFLDPCLRQLNQNNQLFIAKCNTISNLDYSLQSCKPFIKTILLLDKELPSQTLSKISQNQTLLKNKQNFKCWFYTTNLQCLDSNWFHSEQVQIVTSDQEKIITLLKEFYQKMQIKLNSYNSTTTIQSGDRNLMDIKLQIQGSPEKEILGEGNFYSKGEDVVSNGVPNVGAYDIRKDNSWMDTKGNRFGRSK